MRIEPCKHLRNSQILPEEHLTFQGRCSASVLCVYSLHSQDNIAHRVLAHVSTHSQESLELMAVPVETHMLPGLVPAFLLKLAQIDCFLIPDRGSQLHEYKGHNCQPARQNPSCQDVNRVPRVCTIMAGCHGHDCRDISRDPQSPLRTPGKKMRRNVCFH